MSNLNIIKMEKLQGKVVKIVQPLVFEKQLGSSMRNEQVTSIVCLIKPHDAIEGTFWERVGLNGFLLLGMSIKSSNYLDAYPIALRMLLTNPGDEVEFQFGSIFCSQTASKIVIFENFINLTQPYLNKI